MRRALLGTRSKVSVLGLVAAAALVSGCGGQGAAVETRVDSGRVVRDVFRTSPTPTPKPTPARSSKPSLPPGDPGLDAPSAPDPGARSGRPRREAPRRTVPASALLTAGDVRMVGGAGWRSHPGGGDECVRPEGASALRSMTYGGTDAGLVVETVATYRGPDQADDAVRALDRAAAACGWSVGADPRLGSASVAATDGPRSMVGVSTEGVVVLLLGTGEVTKDAVWGSLVDLALGTSCPAAPDGCH